MNDVWHDLLRAEPGAETTARSPLQDLTVMMVDDEPLMTALIETHLEDAGYTRFIGCNDPRDALALARRERPGVVLLDLMMPQMSGFEVLEAMRADEALRYTPVIVLTAATGSEARLRALRLGATDFLSKPVDESELVLRVRNTLAFQQYADRALHHDPVTDLPNDRLFTRAIDAALERMPTAGGLVALVSVELPDGRQLRESFGQRAADELARVVAQRLRRFAEHEACTRDPTLPPLARLDADDYALLLEGLASVDAVEAVAKRLLCVLAAPAALSVHEVVPTAWIGVALAPVDGCDAETLRKSADLAAGHARQHGALSVMFASPELNVRSQQRMTLGAQLRGAAGRGELRLHYQPQVDLVHGGLVGAEALVRWQHPQHGLMAPAEFVPLAEEMGLITGIGEWVLGQACRDTASWSHRGLGDLRIAVNVAKPQFLAGNLCAVLRQALFDAGLPPERLVVELTESMLMDDVAAALALMHELKGLGVTLSIDDFGTGYSSLGYLKRFPLDELKIDRSFVTDLPGGRADEAIARAVVELGHNLGMTVIAEGVETEAQRACLAALGCDTYQGFLFSRPLPAEAFVALLESRAAAGAVCAG
ncbi:MAG: EAL domain-containing protein [Rubrivivax sp.]|nr:EAL domain-containing protein [Rubrivivax sp.]